MLMPGSGMTDARPLRILLSSRTRERLGDEIAAAMNGRPFELVTASPTRGDEPEDVDVGFITREVTGTSTKHVVLEALESFYTSLRRSPRLRWVHVHSAGADRPIFGELRARDVRVTTSSGANAEVVAQTALGGVLALARCFPKLFRSQQRRQWTPLLGADLPADLGGQTAAVVGWGPIGQRVARFLHMLGLQVIVARTSAEPAAPEFETIAYESLDAVAGRIDWLVLACPLTERTRGLVSRRTFDALKKGARLVNVARGEIVAEVDMIEALNDGRLAGACLDVFEFEPLDAGSPLWDMEQVIVMPHAAGHSDGNEGRVDRIFLAHLRELAAAMDPPSP
jgi:phosphoglycerate dehydrogenase-like enzyme